ncbi:MAG: hypothetical protein OXD54_01330 [Candidatus Poribacteria bacterium]|nr:hypothetical protein [Candidatus Poribacteria bacterium]
MELYARIGVTEYFLYDAERRYLPVPLMGFRLVNGSYVEVPQQTNGGFFLETLNLSIHLRDDSFGVYNPDTEMWLLSVEERAE